MNYTNGYFRLDIRENGVYVHIYPEKDGGKKIVIQELAEYFEKCGIHEYNLPELNKAIEKATEEEKNKIIVDNVEKMANQECEGITIPREEIRVSLKKSTGQTEIYKLSDLEDGILLSTTADALQEAKYTIRLWVNNDTSLPSGSEHHYHGLIQIVENDQIVAVR